MKTKPRKCYICNVEIPARMTTCKKTQHYIDDVPFSIASVVVKCTQGHRNEVTVVE